MTLNNVFVCKLKSTNLSQTGLLRDVSRIIFKALCCLSDPLRLLVFIKENRTGLKKNVSELKFKGDVSLESS